MLIEYLADREELIPELANLYLTEWSYLNPSRTLEDRLKGLRGCLNKGIVPFIIVATNVDELVGSAALVEHDMSTRKDLSPWLASLFVKPQFRKAGVATTLVQRIEAEAFATGVHRLYLYTDKESSFYAKRGWKTLKLCEYHGASVTIMFKSISGGSN